MTPEEYLFAELSEVIGESDLPFQERVSLRGRLRAALAAPAEPDPDRRTAVDTRRSAAMSEPLSAEEEAAYRVHAEHMRDRDLLRLFATLYAARDDLRLMTAERDALAVDEQEAWEALDVWTNPPPALAERTDLRAAVESELLQHVNRVLTVEGAKRILLAATSEPEHVAGCDLPPTHKDCGFRPALPQPSLDRLAALAAEPERSNVTRSETLDPALAAPERPAGLDAAWAEAEAALPEGASLCLVSDEDGNFAEAERAHQRQDADGRWSGGFSIFEQAATPAEALRALAARLSDTAMEELT